MIAFRSKKKDLLKVLKHLYPGRRMKYSNYRVLSCEITIINAKVTFAARGSVFSMDCITHGTAKVTVPLHYIYDIIESDPSKEMEFEVSDSTLKINKLTINVETCFFEDDSILKTIRLPMNYDDCDVLRLTDEHTLEELIFNKINSRVCAAKNRLDRNIAKAASLIREYGVTKDEIEKLVAGKLFKNGKIPD